MRDEYEADQKARKEEAIQKKLRAQANFEMKRSL